MFSHLSQRLAGTTDLTFHDVYSLDEPDMLALIPRPALALIFTCPNETFHRTRDEEYSLMTQYAGVGEHPVIWLKQTIHNACGLMAWLHAMCNGQPAQFIRADSALDKLRKAAVPLSVEGRALLLENSQALEHAHAEAAVLGDTSAPPARDHPGNHYICFVKSDDGRLWELNGGMKGPIDRGVLAADEDVLSDTALKSSIRPFLEKAHGDARFTIVAMSQS